MGFGLRLGFKVGVRVSLVRLLRECVTMLAAHRPLSARPLPAHSPAPRPRIRPPAACPPTAAAAPHSFLLPFRALLFLAGRHRGWAATATRLQRRPSRRRPSLQSPRR